MDTSETYIKMCEMAEEIQKSFDTPLPAGTFWVRKSEGYYSEGVTGYNCKKLPECIILPRQDQLQEMISIQHPNCSPIDNVAKAYKFHNWMTTNDGSLFGYGTAPLSNPSMEQLWFAFMMKEEHGKIWKDYNWVQEDSK